jgi:hypothetical protein
MKWHRAVALFVIIVLVTATGALGAQYNGLKDAQRGARTLDQYLKKGSDIAYRITELTGVALSPLVGLAVVGGIEYYKAAKEGKPIRWYFSLWFLGVLALILLLIGLKDTIGELVPFFKKPLDALDFIQHKLAGILAFCIVAPQLILALLEPVGQAMSSLFWYLDPVSSAYAAGSASGGATGVIGVVLIVTIVVCTIAAALFFAVIWLAAGAVEALILISPIPFVALILRGFRLSILGVLGLAVAISPLIGLFVSLVILYTSYRFLGWSFRLCVFGCVLVYDPLTGRRDYVTIEGKEPVRAFSSTGIKGVRNRSYGRLSHAKGSLVFEYRPWLVLPIRKLVCDEPSERIGIARGTFFPSVIAVTQGHRKHPVLFHLPPRYEGHEQGVAQLLGLGGGLHDQRLGKRLADAWRWIVGQAPDDGLDARPA